MIKFQPLLKNSFRKGRAPIVPKGGVVGRALTIIIAIMTFLSALTSGGVDLVRSSTDHWQNQINREATVQIRPQAGQDMEANLAKAAHLISQFQGVKSANIIDEAATKRLLSPWLGDAIQWDALPLPRIIVVKFSNRSAVDFSLLRNTVINKVPGASFNDHQKAVERLLLMAQATVWIGLIILSLVLTALVLTIIFATRSALATNIHIVEVLHFIGAEAHVIARQFDWHFFVTGLRGSLWGGGLAILFFWAFSSWETYHSSMPEAEQLRALFGRFSLDISTYGKIFALALFVALLTMLTSRLAIICHLKSINQHESDLF
ncbi:cell division protein FtsX [Bartonella sp. DGB2]|uniref:cell division protein FtsX n=1 Tax=Bartonella sp. DGB2 TaxID=3388426 RepID=UPI00398FDEEA